ncbi:MAG TPA: hypothetical protein VNG32_03225 [Candidatus Dormibacteraeota bacterium]|nr:hypothetical protein [Candidatus Dormibacteraeota bacterium]
MTEPSISVDRAVNYYLESIDIWPTAAAGFYEDLPIEDKPPLEDCHIHFSGLAQYAGHALGKGVHLMNPIAAKKHDPQAPESDILIFVGSFVKAGNLERMNKTLKHELTHYAQGEGSRRDQITQRETILLASLSSMGGTMPKILFAGKTALYTGLVEVISNSTGDHISPEKALAVGTGIAAVSSVINRRKKRRTIHNLEQELQDIQLSLVSERQADGLSDSDHQIIQFTPRANLPDVIYRLQGKRTSAANRLIDKAHQAMSLVSPQQSLSD